MSVSAESCSHMNYMCQSFFQPIKGKLVLNCALSQLHSMLRGYIVGSFQSKAFDFVRLFDIATSKESDAVHANQRHVVVMIEFSSCSIYIIENLIDAIVRLHYPTSIMHQSIANYIMTGNF